MKAKKKCMCLGCQIGRLAVGIDLEVAMLDELETFQDHVGNLGIKTPEDAYEEVDKCQLSDTMKRIIKQYLRRGWLVRWTRKVFKIQSKKMAGAMKFIL